MGETGERCSQSESKWALVTGRTARAATTASRNRATEKNIASKEEGEYAPETHARGLYRGTRASLAGRRANCSWYAHCSPVSLCPPLSSLFGRTITVERYAASNARKSGGWLRQLADSEKSVGVGRVIHGAQGGKAVQDLAMRQAREGLWQHADVARWAIRCREINRASVPRFRCQPRSAPRPNTTPQRKPPTLAAHSRKHRNGWN